MYRTAVQDVWYFAFHSASATFRPAQYSW